MDIRKPLPTSATILRRALATTALVGLLAFGVTSVLAASAPYLKVASYAAGTTQDVELDVNKSMIVDLPTNVGEVIVSQPSLATVVMRTKTRAIIQGIGGGETNIFFLDPAGNNIAVFNLSVGQPRSDIGNALQAAIARNVRGSHIIVESVLLGGGTNRIVLSGTAQSQDDVQRALAIATQFAGDAQNVASIVTVAGNQQVMLKVTVAEVNRTVVKELGLNLDISSGGLITGLVNSPNGVLGGVSGVASGQGTVTASATIGGTTIDATLKALARRNAVRTLAEPTLTAMSGQPATFLAGGEKAISVVDSSGNTTTTYKQYGVQLAFTPIIKSNGVINLLVDTTVSEPVGSTDFTTRSAKTTVEVPAGATLAIGGLLQDTWKHQISTMPGLGDIPILGALFRSRDYIHDQTELVIMVTPVLADTGRPELPTDTMQKAGDAEAIFLGQMEKNYGVGADGMRGGYSGSVGFVLD